VLTGIVMPRYLPRKWRTVVIFSAINRRIQFLPCDDCFPFTVRSSPKHPSRMARTKFTATPTNNDDDTDFLSTLISQLAEVAIRRRLADQRDVSCVLFSKSSDLLLRGRVGPVTIKGKGWKSERGLTCRAIEATVGTCELDIGRILAERKLILTTPALGKAMIALNSKDFGNFITHPLMKPPSIIGNSKNQIRFLKEGTIVDSESGTVTFCSTYGTSKYDCALKRGSPTGGPAIVDVIPADSGSNTADGNQAMEMAQALGCFFNEMIFELDGTFLSFQDMMVTPPSAKGTSPSVMLALNTRVVKFPSPGVDF
jgi:hypothetical protein